MTNHPRAPGDGAASVVLVPPDAGAPGRPPAQPPAHSGAGERARRLAAVRGRMRECGLGVLVLVGPEDVYYLTGLDSQGYFAFTSLVLGLDGAPALVTRAMEGPTVRALAPGCAHVPVADGADPAPALLAAIRERLPTGGRAGLPRGSMYFPPAIAAHLTARGTGLRCRDASNLVADVRAVKSPSEIAHMRAAAALTDRALAAGIAAARHAPGIDAPRHGTGHMDELPAPTATRDMDGPAAPTATRDVDEPEVAAAIYRAMIAGGGEPPGFAPLVRPLGMLAQEHVSWSGRPVGHAPGDGLFFELSASVRHYHAPRSQVVHTGRPPRDAYRAHDAAFAGFAAIRAALRPGVPAAAVYEAWREAVERVAPQDGAPPRHHCGYLVGIGFPPSWVGGAVRGLRPGDDTPVQAGMTFHAMSWVQRPAGHVISGTLLVTPDGAEPLTAPPDPDLTVLLVPAPRTTPVPTAGGAHAAGAGRDTNEGRP